MKLSNLVKVGQDSSGNALYLSVDATGKLNLAPGSIGDSKVGDDIASGGPYFLLTDTSGQLIIKPADDGSGPYYMASDASGNIYTLKAALTPGEDSSNDWIKIRKQSLNTFSPSETAGTAITTSLTDVLASTDVLGYSGFTLYIVNAGGGSGDAFSDVNVLVSHDNSQWTSLDWGASTTGVIYSTDANTLAASASAIFTMSKNSWRYVKVEARAGASDTTVDCAITANLG